MKDPSEEEEIVECSSCGEVGESRFGWILKTGLRWGKKAMIMGIVLSSAPVVLPPLVVISALGFACSVPYGVVFASYVGTEKLMSNLLPPPIQSPEIEYSTASPIDESKSEMGDDKEGGVWGEKVSVEVGDHDDELKAGEVDNEEEREERLLEPSQDEYQSLNGITKTDDHDVVVSMELRDNKNKALPIVEGQVHVPSVENEGENHVAGMRGSDEIEEEENVEVEDRSRQLDSTPTLVRRKKEQKDDELSEETKISSEERGPVAVQETSRDESSRLLSDNEQAGKALTDDLNVRNIYGSLGKEQKPVVLKEVQEKSGDETSSEEAGGQEGVMPGSEILSSDYVGNVDGSIEKEQKPVGLEELPKGQSAEDGAVSDVGIKTNKETAETVSENDKVTESYSMSRVAANGAEYSAEVATINVTPEPKHEEVPQSKGKEDAPAVYTGLRSKEAALHNEDIWKKIDAIRGIVGFKTPRQPSYFEELKALYIFTGIEPPSSSMDPTDLSEFNNKLSFLMSVIGVK